MVITFLPWVPAHVHTWNDVDLSVYCRIEEALGNYVNERNDCLLLGKLKHDQAHFIQLKLGAVGWLFGGWIRLWKWAILWNPSLEQEAAWWWMTFYYLKLSKGFGMKEMHGQFVIAQQRAPQCKMLWDIKLASNKKSWRFIKCVTLGEATSIPEPQFLTSEMEQMIRPWCHYYNERGYVKTRPAKLYAQAQSSLNSIFLSCSWSGSFIPSKYWCKIFS